MEWLFICSTEDAGEKPGGHVEDECSCTSMIPNVANNEVKVVKHAQAVINNDLFVSTAGDGLGRSK